MRRTPIIPVATAALALLATSFAPAANADEPAGEVVADGLVSALSLAVADDGTVFVSQNFASLITMAAPGAEPEVIFADEGHRDIGGLSVDGDTLTFSATGPGDVKVYTYEKDDEGWAQTEVADLWAFEKSTNPDKSSTYGIANLSKSCKKDTAVFLRQHKGGKDSHPYNSAQADGVTYIADAGANAILAVNGSEVSTVAVLPPTKITITKQIRKALKAPKCTIGKKLAVEPVPTDVEVGPDGNLYVTSLPGGPEDPAMGANGALYQVNPQTGKVTKMAGGLVSPTGLAIGPDGTAYIAMMFASTVLAVPYGGTPTTFAELPAPGDVDVHGGYVYITESGVMDEEGAPPSGKVWKFPTAM